MSTSTESISALIYKITNDDGTNIYEVDEIFIPSYKIAFNYTYGRQGHETLNVFRSNEPNNKVYGTSGFFSEETMSRSKIKEIILDEYFVKYLDQYIESLEQIELELSNEYLLEIPRRFKNKR